MPDDELIAAYVEPESHLGGVEEARLLKYGVPVWALIAHWRVGGGDADAVARDYDLPRQAVEAALAYYGRHGPAIDARIAANAA